MRMRPTRLATQLSKLALVGFALCWCVRSGIGGATGADPVPPGVEWRTHLQSKLQQQGLLDEREDRRRAAHLVGAALPYPCGTDEYEPPGPVPADPDGAEVPPYDESDSVYLFSGEFWYEVEDLRIPGRGLDFVWSRKYRSQAGCTTDLAHRWDFSYNIYIERFDELDLGCCDPPALPCCDDLPLLLHDGHSRREVFTQTEDGTYVNDGFFMEGEQQPDGSFLFTFPHKGLWDFHPLDASATAGKIRRIQDRNGNALLFAYDGLGRLVTVTDTLGRDISIAYHPETGFMQSVTDFAGRQVVYEHYLGVDPDGSLGDLKSARSPTVVSTPFFQFPSGPGHEFPFGKKTVYTYEAGSRLTSITDPKQQTYLRNSYNFQGRVESQELGDAGDLIHYTYQEYTPPTYGPQQSVIRTTVNDRRGNVSKHYFDERQLEVLREELTGQANPDLPTTDVLNLPGPPLRPDDPASFDTVYSYNADLLLAEVVHPRQNSTRFTYEVDLDPDAARRSRGNLRDVLHLTGGLSSDPSILEVFTYHPEFNYVTTATDGRGNTTTHEYDGAGNRVRTVHRIPQIEEFFGYNGFGQLVYHVHPTNGKDHTGTSRLDEFRYYSSGAQRGYLEREIIDSSPVSSQGLTTRYEYDLVGNVTRVHAPKSADQSGQDTRTFVNQLGQIVREESREVAGGVRYATEYFYDLNDNLVRVDVEDRDENGVLQGDGFLTTLFEYEILNRVTLKTREVDGAVVVQEGYLYDDNRNLMDVFFGEAMSGAQPGNRLHSVYDERDLLFYRTRGFSTPGLQSRNQRDYDANGNLKRLHEGEDDGPAVTARVHVWEYDGHDRMTVYTDPLAYTTSYQYDANGNRVHEERQGQLALGVGPLVRLGEATFVFDAMDRNTRIERAFFDAQTQTPLLDGISETVIRYSDTSQVVELQDDRGNVTQTLYDTANRTAAVLDAEGNTTTYVYDRNSNVVETIEAELSQSTLAVGLFKTEYDYDGLDRVVEETDNLGHRWELHYDSRDNLVLTRDPTVGASEVRYHYDGLDRLVTTVRDLDGDGADGDGPDITTQQGWDDSSRLGIQVDDNGNATSYSYDELDRLSVTTLADAKSRTVVYDTHDNPIGTTDPNGTQVVTTFDALDRPVGRLVTVFGGATALTTKREEFDYDGLSRLVRAENWSESGGMEVPSTSLTLAHDSLSNVVLETLDTHDGFGVQTVAATYDGVGSRTSCTYPSQRVLEFCYDQLNRLDVIAQVPCTAPGPVLPIADIDYVGPRRVELCSFGNQTRKSILYDGDRRIIRTVHAPTLQPGPSGFDDRSYLWDEADNKVERSDAVSGETQTFVYDQAYRLIQSTDSAGTVQYALDGVGNRGAVSAGTTSGGGGSARGMTSGSSAAPGTAVLGPAPNPGPPGYVMDCQTPEPADCQVNQYTQTPFDTRTYDGNGNLNSTDLGRTTERSYRYDYANRLVGFTNDDEQLDATYVYDALGRRVLRCIDVGGVTSSTRYVHSGVQVLEEQDAGGALTYVYGNYVDEPLQMARDADVDGTPEEVYFYHCDDNYNVVAVTDGAGTVRERYEYEDFGAPTMMDGAHQVITTSGVGNAYLFSGRRLDEETGWYFYRSRYLDPLAGRFVSRDQLGTWGDSANLGNAASYAKNSPWSNLDPLGEEGFSTTGAHLELHGDKKRRWVIAGLRALQAAGWRLQTDSADLGAPGAGLLDAGLIVDLQVTHLKMGIMRHVLGFDVQWIDEELAVDYTNKRIWIATTSDSDAADHLQTVVGGLVSFAKGKAVPKSDPAEPISRSVYHRTHAEIPDVWTFKKQPAASGSTWLHAVTRSHAEKPRTARYWRQVSQSAADDAALLSALAHLAGTPVKGSTGTIPAVARTYRAVQALEWFNRVQKARKYYKAGKKMLSVGEMVLDAELEQGVQELIEEMQRRR